MEKLANLRGKCYGVMVEAIEDRASGVPFFFPVRESPCVSDGVPIRFGQRPPTLSDENTVRKLLDVLNTHARKIGEEKESPTFVSIATLVDSEEKSIGLALGDPGGSFLPCYFSGGGKVPEGEPTISIPYAPLAIDTAIVESRGEDGGQRRDDRGCRDIIIHEPAVPTVRR